MKFVESKRVAVLAMAAVLAVNTTGCMKTAKKVNDVTSEGVVGTVVDAMTQKDITQLNVHGMKVDAREYAQKVAYDKVQEENWMDETYETLVEEWDKKGMRVSSSTNMTMITKDWYKNYEFSEETQKNKEKYREVTIDLYPQKKEDDIYGMGLIIESFKAKDERKNYDFQIGGISEKDVAKDYEKKSDFYPTLGPMLHGDVFRTNLNDLADDAYGKSYIAIYVDGESVDISKYEKETRAMVDKALEDNDSGYLLENQINYIAPGMIGRQLSSYVVPISMENQLQTPMVEEATKKKFAEYETAGIALVRSVQKLMEGSAKEVVVVVAEERIAMLVKTEESQKDIDQEKKNMRVCYYYLTK